MNKKSFCLLLGFALLSSIFVSGCQEKRPDGLPKLYPCTITLTQKGAPAQGFSVQLIVKEGNCPWMVGGVSDEQGKVVVQTHGKYMGAPAGSYAVTVTKTETEGVDMKADVQTKPIKCYDLVEKKYQESKTTPFEVKIDSKKTEASFDLGEPVRILTETIKPY